MPETWLEFCPLIVCDFVFDLVKLRPIADIVGLTNCKDYLDREFTICKDVSVRIITKKRIRDAITEHSEWKASLESWHKITRAADWKNFPDIKQSWRNVDLVGICVVFDVANNRARLVAHVDYKYHLVFIRFIIGHAEYLKSGWKHDCNG